MSEEKRAQRTATTAVNGSRWRRLSLDPDTRSGKFLREVGSIVLGVLIALLIGALADYLRMKYWARETRIAMDAELARNAGVFDERQMLQPCIERRIAVLSGLIRQIRRTQTLPNIGTIGQTPFRSVESAVWGLTSGSDVMLYLNPEYRRSLAVIYPMIQEYTDGLAQEQDLWASLRVLQRAPGTISDDLLAQVATDVERLDDRARLNGIKVGQVMAAIQHRGIVNDYSVAFSQTTRRDQVMADIRDRSICRPLIVDGKPFGKGTREQRQRVISDVRPM